MFERCVLISRLHAFICHENLTYGRKITVPLLGGNGVGRQSGPVGCERVLHCCLRYKPLARRTDRWSAALLPVFPWQSAWDAPAGPKIDFPPSSCWAVFHVDDWHRALLGRAASIDRSQVMLRPYGRFAAATADGGCLIWHCLNLYLTRLGIVVLYRHDNKLTKGKGKGIYIVSLLYYIQCAQVRITQFYLQIIPYLPLPRKRSSDGVTIRYDTIVCI